MENSRSFCVTFTLLRVSQYSRGLYCRIVHGGKRRGQEWSDGRKRWEKERWENRTVQHRGAMASLLAAKLQSCIPMTRLTHPAPIQPRCVCVCAWMCACVSVLCVLEVHIWDLPWSRSALYFETDSHWICRPSILLDCLDSKPSHLKASAPNTHTVLHHRDLYKNAKEQTQSGCIAGSLLAASPPCPLKRRKSLWETNPSPTRPNFP